MVAAPYTTRVLHLHACSIHLYVSIYSDVTCMLYGCRYLTLDADVVCVRRTGYSDLIRDGRALVNMTPLGRHRDWHEDADRLLGTWLAHEHHDEQLTLGVTPSLLHTESVRQLGLRLEAQHPTTGSWREVLASHASPSWHTEHEPGRWTGEYALYFTFLWVRGTHALLSLTRFIIQR